MDSSWKGGEYLSDVSYDGRSVDGYLVNGLGRLVDGILGGDNFKIDIGYGKGEYCFLYLLVYFSVFFLSRS